LPRRTGASGKSGFPARAGFWGRRNSVGDLVPLTNPELPATVKERRRRRLLFDVGVLLASAVLSFLAVAGVMQVWTQVEGGAKPVPKSGSPSEPAPR
jgi:hypothetical protein